MNKIDYVIEPESLLLTWQEPETRKRYVVGRVTRENSIYCLRYEQGPDLDAAIHKGFSGYPAFPCMDKEYRFGVMESFVLRLPPRFREDFDKFMEYWNFDPHVVISDFALLGYTGAALPRDGFRFLPVFPKDASKLAFMIEVVGDRCQGGAFQQGEAVRFIHDADNQYDNEAIRVETLDGSEIGYVMRGLSQQVLYWMRNGRLSGEVVRINGTSERQVVFVHMNYSRQTFGMA